jgi:hypothetical protein
MHLINQRIEDPDAGSLLQEQFDYVRTDETGTAGNQDSFFGHDE